MNLTLSIVYLSQLKNRQFVEFFDETLVIFQQTKPNLLPSTLVSALSEHCKGLHDAYKKQNTSLYTSQLIELDKNRDLALSSLMYWIKSLLKDPSKKDLLNLVLSVDKVIQRYGGGKIPYFDYNGETAAINNLLEDIQKECKQAIQPLELQRYLDMIQAANLDFIKHYNDREANAAETALLGKMKEMRKKATLCYRGLEAFIVSSMVIEGENQAAYKDLVLRMNEKIGKYNLLIPKKGDKNEKEVH